MSSKGRRVALGALVLAAAGAKAVSAYATHGSFPKEAWRRFTEADFAHVWITDSCPLVAAKVAGIADATDLETTAHYEGCTQVTRQRKITDKRGQVHEIEVTVYGRKLIVLIDARTTIPLAATVMPIHEYGTLSLRALVT